MKSLVRSKSLEISKDSPSRTQLNTNECEENIANKERTHRVKDNKKAILFVSSRL